MTGIKLTPLGEDMVRRGVDDDGGSDDAALIREIIKRGPGMSLEETREVFVAIRTEYGENALQAILSGHVKFMPREDADE